MWYAAVRPLLLCFFQPTLIYYQVWIVCSILTIARPQDNQCWWVWAAFALKVKPLPHTRRTNHNQRLFLFRFPFYLLFGGSFRQFPQSGVHLITHVLFTHPCVVFFWRLFMQLFSIQWQWLQVLVFFGAWWMWWLWKRVPWIFKTPGNGKRVSK